MRVKDVTGEVHEYSEALEITDEKRGSAYKWEFRYRKRRNITSS